MAVYTLVSDQTLAAFLERHDVGTAVMAKGIAEGVSNSNYLVETERAGERHRFILTLYERRVDEASLPYVLALMAHLADAGLPVPRPVPDRNGAVLSRLSGRPASLIAYLPGVSASEPSPAHCRALGQAMARLHLAAADFPGRRENPLGPESWRRSLDTLGPRLDLVAPGLSTVAQEALAAATAAPEAGLPLGTIHADLFPDNVLFLGTTVSGLIDFAFAGDDRLFYDMAVAHAAWAFSEDGCAFYPERAEALLDGYAAVRAPEPAELAALPRLCVGAALRFLLSRAEDWGETGSTALVRRKDPLAFARRLRHYLNTLP
jgi:homoserine kinase type II